MEKERTLKNGYILYPADKRHPYPRIFCRDNPKALEDIRQVLNEGITLLVCNEYETFYGCDWGDYIIKGTQDIAKAEITDLWDAWGDCMPYPSKIVLTPKVAIK